MSTRPITASAVRAAPIRTLTTSPPPAEGGADTSRDEVRRQVRLLLEQSPAFRNLSPEKQKEIAFHTVQVCDYLASPEGIPGHRLAAANAASAGRRPSRALAGDIDSDLAKGKFKAQAVREGAQAAGLFLQAVNFPAFVGGLIQNVFHAIVQSSIQQMEEYGKLVKSVAMTLNQFRDENVSANQGRDHLLEQFPDLFELSIDTGEEGEQPRVRMREGVDEDAALKRVNQLPVDGGPVSSLDDETIEQQLVPAARTQLATSRQQLLATMVMMGINRIVVTDGRIAAKVLFDFQARDNFRWQHSATRFDYGKQYKYASEGEYESEREGGEYSKSKSSDGGSEEEQRDASYYSKGKYKYAAEPVLTLASATQAATDAALQTKANLTGQVEVNFKSETFPLEKLADSFQIAQIQDAAKPGQARARPAASGTAGGAAGGAAAGGGAAGGGPQTPASTPAPAA
jgi:hypothetical protein